MQFILSEQGNLGWASIRICQNWALETGESGEGIML
jgi:hypothetical protein